jgi:hypothetical protein
MLLFPSNDLFNVERKGGFFNPFCSLLVCAFFISGGKNRQSTRVEGTLKEVQFVRKHASVTVPDRWSSRLQDSQRPSLRASSFREEEF